MPTAEFRTAIEAADSRLRIMAGFPVIIRGQPKDKPDVRIFRLTRAGPKQVKWPLAERGDHEHGAADTSG